MFLALATWFVPLLGCEAVICFVAWCHDISLVSGIEGKTRSCEATPSVLTDLARALQDTARKNGKCDERLDGIPHHELVRHMNACDFPRGTWHPSVIQYRLGTTYMH